MPEPTKTPSAPRRIIRAASAGVAIPPAAKLTTDKRCICAVSTTSSIGASISLATRISSSLVLPESARISPIICFMCFTAWLTSPVPASPLVRIMAAPSLILRRASPRFLAPQTKGTVNCVLSIWKKGSAGVSTSDSSTMSTPSASRISASTKCPILAFAITGMVTVSMIC